MHIQNSTISDLTKIFELYRIASAFMKSKGQVYWPEFDKDMVITEIKEDRQFKIIIENEIACIWAIALNDELIWGSIDNQPSVYLHRIATNPNFRGKNFVGEITKWADDYCIKNNLKYVRMDTIGNNQGLIKHYGKHGFEFIGSVVLENTLGLPEHYNDGPVSLFQREVKK